MLIIKSSSGMFWLLCLIVDFLALLLSLLACFYIFSLILFWFLSIDFMYVVELCVQVLNDFIHSIANVLLISKFRYEASKAFCRYYLPI